MKDERSIHIAMILFMDLFFLLPEASLEVLIVRCVLSRVSSGVSIGLASYIHIGCIVVHENT